MSEDKCREEFEKMEELVGFLLGESSYMGLHFGDSVKYGRTQARFWWRTDLRKLWQTIKDTRASASPQPKQNLHNRSKTMTTDEQKACREALPQDVLDEAIEVYAASHRAGGCPDHCVAMACEYVWNARASESPQPERAPADELLEGGAVWDAVPVEDGHLLVMTGKMRKLVPENEELVERVANAIWKITPSFGDMTWEEALEIYSGDNKLLVTIYRVMAEAALTEINLPAIRAQARKEALEEAAKVCDAVSKSWIEYENYNGGYGDSFASLGAESSAKAIRNLIEKEG